MHLTLKHDANFRWLLRGGILSHLGDQLTIVALPLLVLQLTGDPRALGAVIALIGLPRAVLIFLGGAVVDRLSPQRVLMATKLVSAILLGLLALLVRHPDQWQLGGVTVILMPHLLLTLVCILAFLLGLAQAFGIPAATAILPAALPAALLERANGALMGLRQLAMLLGPLLAALLLDVGQHGLALAFACDALSFVVSAWTLSRVVSRVALQPAPATAGPLLRTLGAGLAMAWRDVPFRLCLLYWAAVALLLGGAMQVALPLLAQTRLHGAGTLGILMGAQGAGVLLGMAVAALAGKRGRIAAFGTTILAGDLVAGLLVAPLGHVHTTGMAGALLLAVGAVSGYLQITIYTWIQRRVPAPMMGRAMSIFMFIFIGLAPLSAGGAGWLLTRVDVADLFTGGGLVLVALAASAWLFTPLRKIS